MGHPYLMIRTIPAKSLTNTTNKEDTSQPINTLTFHILYPTPSLYHRKCGRDGYCTQKNLRRGKISEFGKS